MSTEKTPAPQAFGPGQAPRELDLTVWQFEAALRRNLIAAPNEHGMWLAEVISEAATRIEQIRAELPEGPPIGATRAADRVTARLDPLVVEPADIEELAERGLLSSVDIYKNHPLYDQGDLDTVADEHTGLITELVAERQAWNAASTGYNGACVRLGWSREEFGRVARERGLTAGRFGRWALVDIEVLAADEELNEQVRRRRLFGPDQAAQHLQIRRRDFDYLTAAGFLTPATYVESQVGRNRYVDVALYTVAVVEDLLDFGGIDWEQLRAVKPGKPSPLREFTKLPIARATLVRGLAADLTENYGTDVVARYDYRADTWRLNWTPNAKGEPTRETVTAEIRSRDQLDPYRSQIRLNPETDTNGKKPTHEG